MTTYHLMFRHSKNGYMANAKVRAETLEDAIRILKERKPYATHVRLDPIQQTKGDTTT